MGMVQATVNVPQGLCVSALTTQRQHGQDDHHQHQDTDHGDHARQFAQLFAQHLPERTSTVPQGQSQDHEILHGSREHHPDQDPECPRQIPHLRREHRAHQRTGAGDRGKVVSEDDPLVGGHIVQTVVPQHGRRGTARVEFEHFVRDEAAIEAMSDQKHGDRGRDDPDRIDRLAPTERDDPQAEGTGDRDERPHEFSGRVGSPGRGGRCHGLFHTTPHMVRATCSIGRCPLGPAGIDT